MLPELTKPYRSTSALPLGRLDGSLSPLEGARARSELARARGAVSTEAMLEELVDDVAALFALVATAGRRRPSLANIESRVYSSLVRSLIHQGLSMKVVADMFGFANASSLRRRLRNVKDRLAGNKATLRARIVQALEEGPATRESLLKRFKSRDARIVRGVLRDLVEQDRVEESGTPKTYVLRDVPTRSASERSELLASIRALTEQITEACLRAAGDEPMPAHRVA